MELQNSFTVDVSADRAWEVLSDVPTIAPCLPGAKLEEMEGDEYRGVVKVKVGPITAQYKGKASFVELDETDRRMVIRAEGRETKGQGSASALITAHLESKGEGTEVVVRTDLTVTGKVAQFGRGVMADVSAKLMGQFADNLARTVLDPDAGGSSSAAAAAAEADADRAAAKTVTADGGDGPSGGQPAAPSPAVGSSADAEAVADEAAARAVTSTGETGDERSGGVRTFDLPEPEPVDLLEAAGAPTLKRLLPPIIGVVLVLLIVRMLRRRRAS